MRDDVQVVPIAKAEELVEPVVFVDVVEFVEPPQTLNEAAAVTGIAPAWHTAAVLLILFGWVMLGRGGVSAGRLHSRWEGYLSSIMTSWLLLGFVVAGIYSRSRFFSDSLRQNAIRWDAELRRALGIYVTVLFLAAIVFATTAGVLKTYDAMHKLHQQSSAAQSDSGEPQADDTSKPKPPTAMDRFTQSFDRRTVNAIAPRNGRDLMVWVLLCLTAGITEELIFRGYLLQQALAWGRRMRCNERWLRVAVVAVTASIFGGMHLYQGFGGAMMVTLLGVVYAIAAMRFGNLRAVMAAHALQDFLAGLMLMFRHR